MKQKLDVNVLKALFMLKMVWTKMGTIGNCFRHCGFEQEFLILDVNVNEMPLSTLWEQTNVEALSLEEYINIDENILTSAPLSDSEIVEIVNPPSNNNLSEEEDEVEIPKIENVHIFSKNKKICSIKALCRGGK
ncbi:uncharacterized protein LOC124419756 [Lucilia cuprina]|uniref:uncharacterized protein LOC124419756 n=1 Tax=Lucilia cuprina TaxID=7375 RepID=UPI001F058392|nr:uncharacterized protein LOC124419756 [Lucilia cuprina]